MPDPSKPAKPGLRDSVAELSEENAQLKTENAQLKAHVAEVEASMELEPYTCRPCCGWGVLWAMDVAEFKRPLLAEFTHHRSSVTKTRTARSMCRLRSTLCETARRF